nr:reverse transcriptase domain-containing protein [Tanacetum cinerariifolium]
MNSFPPSITTNLRNEISKFQQRFDESFHEAWDRYKDLLRACPHHGFTELHQLDTFYNALNPADQDSLNAAAGGNLLERSTQDVLTIIENKSKVRNSRSKPIASQVKACDVNSNSYKIAKRTHAVNQQTNDVTTAMTAILKQFQATPRLAPVKAVEETCVTCGAVYQADILQGILLNSMEVLHSHYPTFLECQKNFMERVQFCNGIFIDLSLLRVRKGFSGVETPLFKNMLADRAVDAEEEVQVPAQDDVVQEHVIEEIATEVVLPTPTSPSPSSPVIPSTPPHQSSSPPPQQAAEGSSHLVQQVLDKCSALVLRVEGLETANAAQQLEIIKLKDRVNKLERLNKVKSSKLRRLKKVGTSQRVESSEDEENVFNQGRISVDMDQDERVELVVDQEKDAEVEGRQEDTQAEIYNIDLDHSSKVAAASAPIPAAKPAVKPKVLKIVAAPAVSTRKRKGVSREEMEKKDEEIIKSINETPSQKAAKRRKLSEEAQEADNLRGRLEISCNNFPQQKASPAIVELLRIKLPFLEDQFQEDPSEVPPEVPMTDNQTMAELVQAPTKGYEDAIIIPEITANNFVLSTV